MFKIPLVAGLGIHHVEKTNFSLQDRFFSKGAFLLQNPNRILVSKYGTCVSLFKSKSGLNKSRMNDLKNPNSVWIHQIMSKSRFFIGF
jgi:hypothetical protein